ncbi:putative serine/threonine protein kinase [Plesiocystis pacifica SIR-1]|uniref:Putative serine/threonine protein kinase n=1 Tax=Plesiocystis pacifica SIR-1 TaxID=391625 RepID=A6G7A4_9BACT|nr:serine/threonine-protein kinase [Plesiocystis pacifica]EDM78238.1 putative serine/threonine protein kinase [Plesiocystis pacifica SIR-1]
MPESPSNNVVRLDWHRRGRDDVLLETPSASPSLSEDPEDDRAEPDIETETDTETDTETQAPEPVVDAPARPPADAPAIDERYSLEARDKDAFLGELWTATDAKRGREVDVKFLDHLATPKGRERFEQTMQRARTIEHDGLLNAEDHGVNDDGLPYLVFPRSRGAPVSRQIDAHGPLPWPSARRITLELAKALSQTHAHGIFHRDLSPAAVVLLDDPPIGGTSTKLLHACVSRLLRDPGDNPRGVPNFSSPEQLADSGVDDRADVYSLGCILYFLLTGETPFDRQGKAGIPPELHGEPPTFAELLPDGPPIPRKIETIARKAVAKAKDERFSSMTKMRDALAAVSVETDAPGIAPSFSKRGSSSLDPSKTKTLVKDMTGALPTLGQQKRNRRKAMLISVGATAAIIVVSIALFLLIT